MLLSCPPRVESLTTPLVLNHFRFWGGKELTENPCLLRLRGDLIETFKILNRFVKVEITRRIQNLFITVGSMELSQSVGPY